MKDEAVLGLLQSDNEGDKWAQIDRGRLNKAVSMRLSEVDDARVTNIYGIYRKKRGSSKTERAFYG